MTSPGHGRPELREIPREVIEDVEKLYEWTRDHPGKYRPLKWPTPHEKEDWLTNARAYGDQRPDGRLTLRQKRGTTTQPRSVEIQAIDYDPGRSRGGKNRDLHIDQLVDMSLERLRPDLVNAIEEVAAPALRQLIEESVRRLCVEGREQMPVIRTQWGDEVEEEKEAAGSQQLPV